MSTLLRRAPQQARGQRRIDTILDAAEQVLAEAGYQGATTNAIAARANTSIGSLYQFFPNKDAIMQALGLRYLEYSRGVFGPLLAPEAAALPLGEWLDRIVDSLDTTQRTKLGFKELFCGGTTTPELAEANNAMQLQFVLGLDGVLAQRMPALDPERRRIRAEVCVRTTQALMPLLAEATGKRRALLLAEMKAILAGYIEQSPDDAR